MLVTFMDLLTSSTPQLLMGIIEMLSRFMSLFVFKWSFHQINTFLQILT
jgi:hypothetical protein